MVKMFLQVEILYQLLEDQLRMTQQTQLRHTLLPTTGLCTGYVNQEMKQSIVLSKVLIHLHWGVGKPLVKRI